MLNKILIALFILGLILPIGTQAASVSGWINKASQGYANFCGASYDRVEVGQSKTVGSITYQKVQCVRKNLQSSNHTTAPVTGYTRTNPAPAPYRCSDLIPMDFDYNDYLDAKKRDRDSQGNRESFAEYKQEQNSYWGIPRVSTYSDGIQVNDGTNGTTYRTLSVSETGKLYLNDVPAFMDVGKKCATNLTVLTKELDILLKQ